MQTSFFSNKILIISVTDFSVAGKNDAYAWNVIRSEADHIFFKHAAKCGADTLDGIKVSSLQFAPLPAQVDDPNVATPGRPVSAGWTRKQDGSTGTIKFDYLIDASGKTGIVSAKYWKNRVYNSELKNVATWGYFKGSLMYGIGTPEVGQPFFEALRGMYMCSLFVLYLSSN